jgi:hypothetical protein
LVFSCPPNHNIVVEQEQVNNKIIENEQSNLPLRFPLNFFTAPSVMC